MGIVSVSDIVPVNPFSRETVIVEVAEVPASTEAEEVAETEKSATVNVTVVELDRLPLVPVTVTV